MDGIFSQITAIQEEYDTIRKQLDQEIHSQSLTTKAIYETENEVEELKNLISEESSKYLTAESEIEDQRAILNLKKSKLQDAQRERMEAEKELKNALSSIIQIKHEASEIRGVSYYESMESAYYEELAQLNTEIQQLKEKEKTLLDRLEQKNFLTKKQQLINANIRLTNSIDEAIKNQLDIEREMQNYTRCNMLTEKLAEAKNQYRHLLSYYSSLESRLARKKNLKTSMPTKFEF